MDGDPPRPRPAGRAGYRRRHRRHAPNRERLARRRLQLANLEHLYAHQVPRALTEFHRVLKTGGVPLATLPDLQAVAEAVAQGRLEEPLHQSPAGPIAALDMLYGHRPALAHGRHTMAHKTGFTADRLSRHLGAASFRLLSMNRQDYALWAVAKKP